MYIYIYILSIYFGACGFHRRQHNPYTLGCIHSGGQKAYLWFVETLKHEKLCPTPGEERGSGSGADCLKQLFVFGRVGRESQHGLVGSVQHFIPLLVAFVGGGLDIIVSRLPPPPPKT